MVPQGLGEVRAPHELAASRTLTSSAASTAAVGAVLPPTVTVGSGQQTRSPMTPPVPARRSNPAIIGMASRTTVTLIDDPDGGTGEIRTVSVNLDGQPVELDLSQANYEQLQLVLAPYLQDRIHLDAIASQLGPTGQQPRPGQEGDRRRLPGRPRLTVGPAWPSWTPLPCPDLVVR